MYLHPELWLCSTPSCIPWPKYWYLRRLERPLRRPLKEKASLLRLSRGRKITNIARQRRDNGAEQLGIEERKLEAGDKIGSTRRLKKVDGEATCTSDTAGHGPTQPVISSHFTNITLHCTVPSYQNFKSHLCSFIGLSRQP